MRRAFEERSMSQRSKSPPPHRTADHDIEAQPAAGDGPLLLLDDDEGLRGIQAAALTAMGFNVLQADTVELALEIAANDRPAFAVLDLHLPDGSGLDLIEALHAARSDVQVVIQTGYGSMEAAVAAIRAGAADFLIKPARAEELAEALLAAAQGVAPPPPSHAIAPDQARWEHIIDMHESLGRNVSETARRLGMHRRSLQRILSRGQPD
jgi:two-component system response regulator RegA